ncbi:hypothetical protein [Streptomyces sp. NRRL F-5630]|uniref:hypothetical protein n=1 Tax=Streptomyces sp. NRRL F-5630 TaxID=1463864 RepID=UPI001F1F1CA7|nr:hypothetical protein [Streptomyces sp. NRRL F-5630]
MALPAATPCAVAPVANRPTGRDLLPTGSPSPGVAVDASPVVLASSYEAPLAAPYEALSGVPEFSPAGAVHFRPGRVVRVSAP